MDPQTKELARAFMGVAHDEISPGYTQIREQLLGQLSVTGIAFQDARVLAQQKKDNAALLHSVVACLPHAKSFRSETGIFGSEMRDDLTYDYFETKSLEIAHAIQRSVVWITPTSADGHRHKRACYVVGMSTGPTRRADLLLAQAKRQGNVDKDNQLVKVTVSQKQAQRVAAHIDPYHSAIEGDTSVQRLYKEDDDVLEVEFNSAGSLFIRDYLLTPPNPIGRAISDRIRGYQTMQVRIGRFEEDVLGVTDEYMGRLGVFDHLARIAMVFNKEVQIDKLIDAA